MRESGEILWVPGTAVQYLFHNSLVPGISVNFLSDRMFREFPFVSLCFDPVNSKKKNSTETHHGVFNSPSFFCDYHQQYIPRSTYNDWILRNQHQANILFSSLGIEHYLALETTYITQHSAWHFSLSWGSTGQSHTDSRTCHRRKSITFETATIRKPRETGFRHKRHDCCEFIWHRHIAYRGIYFNSKQYK